MQGVYENGLGLDREMEASLGSGDSYGGMKVSPGGRILGVGTTAVCIYICIHRCYLQGLATHRHRVRERRLRGTMELAEGIVFPYWRALYPKVSIATMNIS